MSYMTVDITHMAHLLTLANNRIYTLGPIPTEVPDELRQDVITQLAAAGLTDHDGTRLTELGTSLLDPLTKSGESFWGILTLHNQHQPVLVDVPDHWMPFIGEALRTATITGPRVFFTIARTDSVMTTAVRNGNHFTLTHQTLRARQPFARSVAEFLFTLADPNRAWKPAELTPLSVPYAALADAPARGYTSDAPAANHSAYRKHVTSWLDTFRQKLTPKAASTLLTLMTADHVAAMRILYTHGPELLTSDHAASLDFFHGLGMVATHPRVIADGTLWKDLNPATPDTLTHALTALASTPESQRYTPTITRPPSTSQAASSAAGSQFVNIAQVATYVDRQHLQFSTIDPASDLHRDLADHFQKVVVPAWVASGNLAVGDWTITDDCTLLPPHLTLRDLADHTRTDPQRATLLDDVLATNPAYTSDTDVVEADLILAYKAPLIAAFSAASATRP